ncbi:MULTISPECIES: Gfo/Idh/MocA family protein [Agrobacterium]|uniref:Gfo/Idh/MocA family oxidoreductase n=1 Tax=Agrobacterium salinitolerans TaxID=1183413 RepID=A0A4Z1QV96_9HYPH|nr:MULTISPECIES: Gfo/Idh/MocA family oxidoreductase [Agrobacterium]MCZ7865633.1 Gfo/Idh/MocA family oxidoreductase [Agrobacterium salinitolerans]MDA5639484.1 Gfo/Idh/MocA family oxidoreductase [Agrobacterium sp. ST15.13.013]MDA6999445.1 Gfo/Idh/MocA family oxidoreductase [Agrobacterium salinitolerans]QXC49257.1 Gfo/Idh/MocA family oxidoreductase [Agrobacterium salinitolerans]TZG33320.1 Gfo/Idh/MocA family oxidoreductase [Agrobacterium sp. B1(2019)]
MTFNAVLCGCGAMAKGWLRAIQSTPEIAGAIRIAGLVDLNENTARALAEEFALTDAVIGTDLRHVLAETKADILFDIVIPQARFAVVEAGLEAGCHVLSEKPLAASMEEAATLVELAKNAGRIHAVVQNRRFIAGIRRLRRALEDGIIGDLTAIHCDFFLGPHFGGFREEMKNVLLLDMAIHTFDAARFVANEKPLSVFCVEKNPAGSWYAHGASANAIFEFSNDVVFTYRGSWCAEGERTSWEARWRLIGSKGMILWDGEDNFSASVAGDEQGLLRGFKTVNVSDAVSEKDTRGHASVILSFLHSIRTGEMPETASFDNINSLAMVIGAIESARLGQRVSIAA